MREPARVGAAEANDRADSPATWPELWRYRAVLLPLLGGMVMAEMAFGAAYIWGAPALSRSYGLSPERVGGLMASGLMISGILGPLVGGTLADFCQRSGGPRRTLIGVSVLAVLSLPGASFAFVPDVSWAGLLLVAHIVLVSATIVMATTLFAVVIPNELRGLCMAILFAAGTLSGLGMAPVVVSLLAGALGGTAMLAKALAFTCGAAAVLAAAAFVSGRRYFPAGV